MVDYVKQVFLQVQQYLCSYGYETSLIERDHSNMISACFRPESRNGILNIAVSKITNKFDDRIIRVYSSTGAVGSWITSRDFDLPHEHYLPDLEVFLATTLEKAQSSQSSSVSYG